jgi:hypothetical protein
MYEDYKPSLVYWKLVLIGRKFVFAVVVVLLSDSIDAQVGAVSLFSRLVWLRGLEMP